jgi:copper(I)-binding protein
VHVKAKPVTGRRIRIGLAVVATLLTASCAAGQVAQTADEKPTLDGTNASVGMIDLRALAVQAPTGTYYPSGSDLPLKLVIVNNSNQPDSLTSITSPVASDWGAYATTAQADEVMSAHSSAAAAGSSAPAGSGASLPTPQGQVKVGPNSTVSWGTPTATGALLLLHSSRALYPGTSISMTFTFANAGAVTVTVPIALTATPASSVIPAPSTSGIE